MIERVTSGRSLQTPYLLRLAYPPTAVFPFNDVQALGVYQPMAASRMRIPAFCLVLVSRGQVPVSAATIAGSHSSTRPLAGRYHRWSTPSV